MIKTKQIIDTDIIIQLQKNQEYFLILLWKIFLFSRWAFKSESLLTYKKKNDLFKKNILLNHIIIDHENQW